MHARGGRPLHPFYPQAVSEGVDDAALRTLGERMRRAHPDVRTVIETSARTDHEHVIATLDALRLAGISKIAFAVEPKLDEQAP